MSHLIKIKRAAGIAYRLQYYHHARRYYEHFPPGVPLSLVKARQQHIDSALALDKAGLQPFHPAQPSKDSLTLGDFPAWYSSLRQSERNLAPSTIERYALALKIFAQALGPDLPVAAITTAHIEQFKTHQLEHGKTKSGVNKNLHHLGHPFKLAQRHGFLSILPEIVRYKVPQSLPDFLLPDQIDQLELHLPKGESRLAFQILKWTGIRRSELVDRCYKKDFNIIRKELLIRGKNNELLTVPLAHQLIAYLQADPIFNSRKSTDKIITLSKAQISHAIRIAKQRAGITAKGRTHLLRHSLGCYLINHGFDLREVQRILRHKTLHMTTLYTQILNDRLNQKFQQIDYK